METLNKKNSSISSLYQSLKRRQEVRSLIPMGYVPGMPLLTVKNGQLVAMIPFLRYKVTGVVDRTLVFPVRYVMEYIVPEMRLVAFRDLAIEPGYEETNFDTTIGFFRHEAVKHLNKEQFMELKDDTLSLYDSTVNFLIGTDEVMAATDEEKLRHNLQQIIEPFVQPVYAKLDSDFYNKYLNGND